MRRALVTGGRAAAGPGRRRWPGWSPGRWSRRCGWPAGSRSGSRPAGSRSGCTCAARTTSPGSATSFNQMAASLQKQIRQLEELSARAAPVRLRRLPRAAHAADHGADGRRRAARRPRPVRPGDRPRRRAAAERARPVRDAARRPAGDQPLRRRRRRARPRGRQPRRRRAPRRGVHAAPLAERAGHPWSSYARASGRASPRSTPAGSSGSCATWSPTRSTTPTASDVVVLRRRPTTRPPRWPSATTASGCSRARRRWCSTGSGAPTRRGPAPPAAPGSACRSRWRTPGCTAAGCRPGASPGGGAQFRLTLPRRAGDRIGASPLPLVPADAALGQVGADYARVDRRPVGRKAGTP